MEKCSHFHRFSEGSGNMLFLAVLWVVVQPGLMAPTTPAIPAVTAAPVELPYDACRTLQEFVHQPSSKMLRSQLEEAKEQGLDSDLLELEDLFLTVERDTNDCPANERERKYHPEVRGRSTCPYKELHLKVNSSLPGALKIFPKLLSTVVSCSSVQGSTFPPNQCRVAKDVEGSCTNVPHRRRILRQTGGCSWNQGENKFYWNYKVISVMVSRTVVCAREKP